MRISPEEAERIRTKGRRYMYPSCCIEAFIARWQLDIGIKNARLHPVIRHVMCPICAAEYKE